MISWMAWFTTTFRWGCWNRARKIWCCWKVVKAVRIAATADTPCWQKLCMLRSLTMSSWVRSGRRCQPSGGSIHMALVVVDGFWWWCGWFGEFMVGRQCYASNHLCCGSISICSWRGKLATRRTVSMKVLCWWMAVSRSFVSVWCQKCIRIDQTHGLESSLHPIKMGSMESPPPYHSVYTELLALLASWYMKTFVSYSQGNKF